MAMLLQSMSAKLGIATGKNLAELCREHFSPPVTYIMWLVAEVGAMATDLAEFLGASIALNLLFGVSLLYGTLATGVATSLILLLARRGFRLLEVVITAAVGVVALCYVVESVLSHPDWGKVAWHATVPWVGGTRSILLSAGILGATVMPHVLYLHSSLTQGRIVPRSGREAQRIFRFSLADVILAMGAAGFINMAMLYMAASTFHAQGHTEVADIRSAYFTLTPLFGGAASLIFAISLLASGLSSSVVGTLAGQVVMQGFIGVAIPVWIRRLVTMLPAVVIAGLGFDPTTTLVLSQVVLSFVLPLPILTLLLFTRRKDLMGPLANHQLTTVLAASCSGVILTLNLSLLYLTFAGGAGWSAPG
jgi:manganese transport protein